MQNLIFFSYSYTKLVKLRDLMFVSCREFVVGGVHSFTILREPVDDYFAMQGVLDIVSYLVSSL